MCVRETESVCVCGVCGERERELCVLCVCVRRVWCVVCV